MSNYLKNAFGEFAELTPTTISILCLLILISVIGIVLIKKSKDVKFTTRMLVYGSLCISLGFILSNIKIIQLPQGGSVTPASMLPMIIFSIMFGPVPGIIAGFAYGFLQYIQDPYLVHWIQLFLDYPLAFGCLGLAGLYRKNLIISSLIGISGRFIMHYLTGVIFFAEYAPEGTPVALYSLTYNGTIFVPEFLICAIIVSIPQVKKMVGHLNKSASSNVSGS